MQTSSQNDRYFTDKQVAARYGVGKATIWRWAASRKVFPKPVKLGPGVTRWRLSDLLAFGATLLDREISTEVDQ